MMQNHTNQPQGARPGSRMTERSKTGANAQMAEEDRISPEMAKVLPENANAAAADCLRHVAVGS